jgi:hypothetical protein
MPRHLKSFYVDANCTTITKTKTKTKSLFLNTNLTNYTNDR